MSQQNEFVIMKIEIRVWDQELRLRGQNLRIGIRIGDWELGQGFWIGGWDWGLEFENGIGDQDRDQELGLEIEIGDYDWR